MGLDIYFCKYKEHPTNERIPMEQEEVGYFRKVNFLVSFFNNRGYTVENCVPIIIDEMDAQELLELCNKVLENPFKGPELLPTCEGFFFGNTDYDEHYIEDVKQVAEFVKDTLLPCLEQGDDISFEISY